MKPPIFADPEHLPGIVLKQPYAGLVRLAALGLDAKSIETRGTRIHHRGALVIVAGLAADDGARARFASAELARRNIPEDAFVEATGLRGVAVALFDVAGCRPLAAEDESRACFFEDGRFAWMPDRIRPLRPFPVQGHQGFLRVSRAQVLAALDGPGWLFCPRCGRRHCPAAVVSDCAVLACIAAGGCGHAWRRGAGLQQAELFGEGAGR